MNAILKLLCVVCLCSLCACQGVVSKHNAASEAVTFHWFDYQGEDVVFADKLAADHYRNPILAGFYPDPSIVRVKDTFYMVNSSFSYFPGVPISRSTDLVHWQSLGYVLDRPSQIDFRGAGVSRGIFAPTIRYHDGVFYMITTNVSGGGNFIVTATDPAGDWSDPYYLPEIEGIDPDLFFDDDGKAYVTHNGPPESEPRYSGHRAIWQWELNLATMKIVDGSGRVIVDAGVDPASNPIWIEGPHVYKINGWYYLMCAEGGTSTDHSEVVFRTRSLQQPFVAWDENPILTQRDLDPARANPIAATGHADLVQTSNGDWWAVFLGTRNYQQEHFNTGRETFLLPVSWHNGWPRILTPGTAIPYQVQAPAGLPETSNAQPMTGNFHQHDDFSGARLDWRWNLLRSGDVSWFSLLPEGGLLMTGKDIGLDSSQQPAFVGRRQQHQRFTAQVAMTLPQSRRTQAGLTVFQNEQAYYFLFVHKVDGGYEISLKRSTEDATEIVASQPLPELAGALVLEAQGSGGKISFSVWPEQTPAQKITVASGEDATILSTVSAGGFVGSYIGMHVQHVK